MPDIGEELAVDVKGFEFPMEQRSPDDEVASKQLGIISDIAKTVSLTPCPVPDGGGGGTTKLCTPTSPASTPPQTTPISFQPTPQINSNDANSIISTSEQNKGVTTGAIAGIAVGVALLAILIGLGILLFIRKRQRSKSEGGDHSEHGMMMGEGKQVDGDDGSGSGVLHAPGSQQAIASGPQQQPLPPSSPPPPTTSPVQHSYHLVDNPGPSSSTHYPAETSVLASAPIDRDLIDRPVSPPLPDDAPDSETHVANPHASSRDLAGTSLSGDVRGNLEEDPEMQWILEEERRAKERKEQQEELRRLK